MDDDFNTGGAIGELFELARITNKFCDDAGLEAAGKDVGGVDGLPGFKTRRSIGEWEKSAGLTPTCYPSPAVARTLR